MLHLPPPFFWKCDIPDSRTVTLTPLAQPNHIARKLLLLREMEKATLKRFSLLGVNAEHDFLLKKFPSPWNFPFRFYLHSFVETQHSRRHTYTVCVRNYCRSKRRMFNVRTYCMFVCCLITASTHCSKKPHRVWRREYLTKPESDLCVFFPWPPFSSLPSVGPWQTFPASFSSLPICYIWGWQIGKASDFPLLPPMVILAFGGEKVPFQEMAV